MSSKCKKIDKRFIEVSLVASLGLFLVFLQSRYYIFDFFPYNRSDLAGFFNRYKDGSIPNPYEIIRSESGEIVLDSVEYPVLTGYVIWATAILLPGEMLNRFRYFDLNYILVSFLFVATTIVLARTSGKSIARLLSYSPPVWIAVSLNWDMWAVFFLVVSIVWFQKKPSVSAVCLGISIAFKFFPIFILLPIVILGLRDRQYRRTSKFLGLVLVTFLSVNLVPALTNFEGLVRFYVFSAERGLGDASIYDVISKLSSTQTAPLLLYYLVNVCLWLGFVIFIIKSKRILTIESIAFIAVFIFVLGSKVYSMQYILWLAPLALMAIAKLATSSKRKLIKFYVAWQFGEILIQYGFFGLYSDLAIPGSPSTTYLEFAVLGSLRYVLMGIFFTRFIQRLPLL
jgi:uncharacterized membrane protein